MNNNHGRRRVRRARRNQAKAQIGRILLTVALMTLVAVVSIGGTLAWLTDKTEVITNTFATTGIEIELSETKYTYENGEDQYADAPTVNQAVNNTYRILPGKTYTKDPMVKVTDNTDVPVYLFVEMTGTVPAASWLTFDSTLNDENGWTQGNTENGVPANVWYRIVNPTDSKKTWNLIANDEVIISSDLTKEDMPQSEFSVSYKAYAIQTEKGDTIFTPADAWTNVPKN